MPCCCETNVQAAFVLGIIGIVFSLCFCAFPPYTGGGIFLGIVEALISAILIYGAHKRNHKAILISIILLILECVGEVIYAIYTAAKGMHFPVFFMKVKDNMLQSTY